MDKTTEKTDISAFYDLLNRYPSPHNGQPIRLRRTGDDTFELFFERERGLQSTDISYFFSFVSMGVFIQHMKLCARALGHGYSYTTALPEEAKLHGEGPVLFGTCRVIWNQTAKDDKLKQALLFRQTSRKKYYEGPSVELDHRLEETSAGHRMALGRLGEEQSSQAIWLNQRAVFDDLFDEPVRAELDHWLRYSQAEKRSKKDGLAYDCMQLNGPVMRFIIRHPGIIRAPFISWILKQYYMRTMKDASRVFYLLAPFGRPENAFEVGRTIMDVWMEVAAAGYYLHPFGTIMSNQAAHHDFLELAGITDESRDEKYLVFIFRVGKSETPVPSLRLDPHEHLVME